MPDHGTRSPRLLARGITPPNRPARLKITPTTGFLADAEGNAKFKPRIKAVNEPRPLLPPPTRVLRKIDLA